MDVPDDLIRLLPHVYAEPPRIYRSPGRVNLIGEHTDYNNGWVLPAAIHLFTWVAAAPRPDRALAVTSVNVNETVNADLTAPLAPRHTWSDYAIGVAWALGRAGLRVPGTTLLVKSEVPFGGGLGSSAAF